MDRFDHMKRIGDVIDELGEDLWLVRTGKIMAGRETSYTAEMLQRFCDRLAAAVRDLADEERRLERLAENKDQLSFFGMQQPVSAPGEASQLRPRAWWKRSSVAAAASALLTLTAIYAFDPPGSATAVAATKRVSVDDLVRPPVSAGRWDAASEVVTPATQQGKTDDVR